MNIVYTKLCSTTAFKTTPWFRSWASGGPVWPDHLLFLSPRRSSVGPMLISKPPSWAETWCVGRHPALASKLINANLWVEVSIRPLSSCAFGLINEGHRAADSINLTQFCRGKLSTAQTLDSDYAISEDDVGDLVNSAASMSTKTLCCHLHAVMDVSFFPT